MKQNKSNEQRSPKIKLPPISSPKEVWDEQLKRTLNNITIRPSREDAEILVFLDLECSIPKATIVKKCLDRALPAVYNEILERLQGLKSRES